MGILQKKFKHTWPNVVSTTLKCFSMAIHTCGFHHIKCLNVDISTCGYYHIKCF